MVVVATHTPCRGGPWTISLRRGPTPKRVPHKVPNPARCTVRHISCFASPLHGMPNPTIRSFRIVSRFGSPLHGVPNPTMRLFRVVSCFTGCPIPESRNARSRMHFAPPPKQKLPSDNTHLPLLLQSLFPQRTACTALVPRPPP